MAKIDTYLKLMNEKEASDLFLSVGAPPYLRVDGATHMLEMENIAPGEAKILVEEIMTIQQRERFAVDLEANFAFSTADLGRFRINAFHQRGEVSAVVRHIRSLNSDFEQLGLPREISELVMLRRGLVLVVGGAGSGKSTSLAAMIGYRADNADEHIVTIEDPIEFLFPRSRSLIDQREVGIDTLSFADALRNVTRESPDVIMIGEIRDMETAHHAIAYAESGHLCFSTMHANSANQAIDRLINFFPEAAHKQVLLDLSLNLEGVISQRLIPGLNGKRVLAVEILRRSDYISEMIREGRLADIKQEMGKGNQSLSKTFDQSLFELYQAGRISQDEAIKNADSRADLSLKMRLMEHQPPSGLPGAGDRGDPFRKSSASEHRSSAYQWNRKQN